MKTTNSSNNEELNKWKIVFIKTIDERKPVYYRMVNTHTYEVEIVPAYRLLDEVINKKKDIINISLNNSEISIINEDGYDSTDEVIIIDEFEKDIKSLFDWTVQHEDIGSLVMSRFDSEKNEYSPSDYKVDSCDKIAWTCENNHTIKCDFSTYFGMKCECPLCKAEEHGEKISFFDWAQLTDNKQLVEEFNNSENNEVSLKDISYNARKKVWFKRNDTEVQESLYHITMKKR